MENLPQASINPLDDETADQPSISRTRRHKYTAVACLECQRRKSKCTGNRICALCRARGVRCVYLPTSRRNGRRNATASAVTPPDYGTDHRSAQTEEHPVDGRSKQQLYEHIAELETALRSITAISSASVTASISSSSIQLPPYTSSSTNDVLSLAFNHDTCDNFSLPSLLCMTRNLLGIRRSMNNDFRSDSLDLLTVQFPDISSIRAALNLCSQKLSVYQPVLVFESLDVTVLHTLNISSNQSGPIKVTVKPEHLCKASRVCMALALSYCFDEQQNKQNQALNAAFYSEALRLLKVHPNSPENFIELAKFHLMRATYLTQADMLQAASSAIWETIFFAMQARLNDESSWLNISCDARVARRRLWWSIYYYDRRLAQKCGRSCIIRDDDVSVRDLCAKEDFIADRAQEMRMNEEKQSEIFLQTLVDISKLWHMVWDTLLKPSAQRTSGVEDAEILDIRIAHVQRKLPVFLKWKEDLLQASNTEQMSYLDLTRKLVIFTRINLLRLLIRQNASDSTLTDGRAVRSYCILAYQTIQTLSRFITNLPPNFIRYTAYFVASSLIECIYHAARIMKSGMAVPEQISAQESMKLAIETLKKLSPSTVVASRTLELLNIPLDGLGATSLVEVWRAEGPTESLSAVDLDLDPLIFSFEDMPVQEESLNTGINKHGFDHDTTNWPTLTNFPDVFTAAQIIDLMDNPTLSAFDN